MLARELELLLVEAGFDELGGGEPAVRAVRSVHVVVDAPALEEHPSFEECLKSWPFKNSSRSRPLNDSIQAFCHGDPGSMNAVLVPLNRHRSATA